MKLFLAVSISILLLFLLLSCNNGNEKEVVNAASDTAPITGLAGEDVKLVKTASIYFKVRDVVQSTREVSALAHELGGMISHQSLQSEEGSSSQLQLSTDSLLVVRSITPQAEIAARIPSQQLEAFLYSVADLGYYIHSSQLDVDDKSLAYLESALKQKNRKGILAQSVSTEQRPIDKAQTILSKDEIIEQQIFNQAIDADVRYSTVSLRLFQNALVQKEVIANTNLSDYQLPFGQRLINAIYAGWQAFLAFVVALAHLWMFIILGIVLAVVYRYWQQKRKLATLSMKV